jgi:deoxyhypusine synthase
MKKYDKEKFGFSWEYPDLSPSQAEKRQGLMSAKVESVAPSTIKSVAALLKAMGTMGIQARNLGSAFSILRQMLTDAERPLVMLGIAGPLIAGGLRQTLREMVEFGIVDLVVSTGAILYQDIYQARGFAHYLGSPNANDAELRDVYLNRIHDVYVDDMGFGETDSWIGLLADSLTSRAYSSREILDHIADNLDDPQSLVVACRKHGVPMFVPALNDSSIGIGLTEHRRRRLAQRGSHIMIDSIKDNYELAQVVAKSPATAAIFIAGGVPKNYINDSVVMSYMFDQEKEGHRFAIQVSTAVAADGGLSGSTLSEAKSWWKMSSDASTAMVWAEPTIVLPMLVAGVIEEGLHRQRARYEFAWNSEGLGGLNKTV